MDRRELGFFGFCATTLLHLVLLGFWPTIRIIEVEERRLNLEIGLGKVLILFMVCKLGHFFILTLDDEVHGHVRIVLLITGHEFH